MSVLAGMHAPALLFGVPIDDTTMEGTLDAVGELVVRGRGQERTHQVATVNVDFLVNALADESIRSILQRADLCIADGMPVVWGARACGMPLTERVAGADLVPALAERAATTGWKVHLFGSAAGTAERACELLLARYPGAAITADCGPMFADMGSIDENVIDGIAAIDPDILCVALGNPKQERFIEAYRGRLRTPVMIGIGGSLDMLVGDKKRAPGWLQRVGLEWVFRAAQEPSRLGRRYARDAYVFFPELASSMRALRRERGEASFDLAISDRSVTISPSLGRVAHVETLTRANAALFGGAPLELDLGTSDALTLPALTHLVGLIRMARRAGSAIGGTCSGAITVQAAALGIAMLLEPVPSVT